MAGKQKEVTQAIDHLRNVASISPNNVQAVENIKSNTLYSSIIDAITDRAVNTASKELLIDGSSDIAASFTKDVPGRDVVPKEEVLAIVAQNEALKNSLSQMRKRNAQLRSKSAAAQLNNANGNGKEKDKDKDKDADKDKHNRDRGIIRSTSVGSYVASSGAAAKPIVEKGLLRKDSNLEDDLSAGIVCTHSHTHTLTLTLTHSRTHTHTLTHLHIYTLYNTLYFTHNTIHIPRSGRSLEHR